MPAQPVDGSENAAAGDTATAGVVGAAATTLTVEVIYAEPQHAVVKVLRLTAPATVEEALRLAAADPDFTGVAVDATAVGIFGRRAAPAQLLKEGDRIEIYRPLAADPKSARRARAAEARRRNG